MIKSFKIRIYPTKNQERIIWEHIGACRFLWNYLIELQQSRHDNGETYLSAFKMMKLLKEIKEEKDLQWMKEISNGSLKNVCSFLNDRYELFFRGKARYPKFKSRKKSQPKYPVRYDRFYLKDGYAVIEKVGKVKYKTDFALPEGHEVKFANVTVSNVNGKWILSFAFECENQAFETTNESMGIDLGIKELAVVAYGTEQLVYHNINKSRKIRLLDAKIRKVQKDVNRKYESFKKRNGKFGKSKNALKDEKKLKRLMAKQSNIRKDYIHKTTHELVALGPHRVVMEKIEVREMLRENNKFMRKQISEQCFYEFIRQMKYKCEWRGIEFVQADKYFPSSKMCSDCGCINRALRLSDRVFECPECGLRVDRDYNAAINLKRYAV